MYRKLMSNDDYESKICGMHFNLAERVRHIRKEGGQTLKIGLEAIKAAFLTRVPQELHDEFSIALGTAMKEEAVSGTTESPIFMYLLSDPTNIDSKMVTSVSKAFSPQQRDAIFNAFYKYDASQ